MKYIISTIYSIMRFIDRRPGKQYYQVEDTKGKLPTFKKEDRW